MNAASTGPVAQSPQAERPATAFQMHRINMLECVRRVAPGEGETISFAEADALLAEAARQGLWTPTRPSTASGTAEAIVNRPHFA